PYGASPVGANINLNNTVNGGNTLTLDAGTGGDITFGGAVGQATRLGGVDLSANDVTATAAAFKALGLEINITGTASFTQTIDLGDDNPLTYTGYFILTSGAFNMGNNTLSLDGNWDSSSATADFNAGTSTVDLTGSGAVAKRIDPLLFTDNDPFYNLKCAAAGQTITLGSTDLATISLEVGSGTITDGVNTYDIHINAMTDGVNIFTDGGASLEFGTLFITPNAGGLTLTVPGRNYRTGAPGTGLGALWLEGAPNVLGDTVYNMTGDIILNDLCVTTNNDLGFTNTSTLNTGDNDITAANLYVGLNGDVTEYGTVNAGNSDITLSGDFAVYASDAGGSNIFNAQTSTLTIGGDFTNADQFNAGTGEVIFNDANQVSHIHGTTFNDLTCTTAGKTLEFDAGATETVNGILTLGNAAGNVVIQGAGGQWTLDLVSGDFSNVAFVSVRDSINAYGVRTSTYADPANSSDLGNTVRWFSPSEPPPPPPPPVVNPIPDPNIDWEVEYEEAKKKRKYPKGRYKTAVIVYEGVVVVTPYDETGEHPERAARITSGQSVTQIGEIK
nr:hypothetical protein [Candidatus Omnitrophota bacterium]